MSPSPAYRGDGEASLDVVMKLSRLLAVFSTPLLAAALSVPAPAHAQGDPAESLRQALSLISSGATDSLGPALQITQDGALFHLRINLPQLTAPPDAAITGTATPFPSGVWQIDSVRLPPTGSWTFRPPAKPMTFEYSVAAQSAQARIDPTLATPSSYQIALEGILLRNSAARPDESVAVGRIALDNTITGEGGNLIAIRAHASAEGLRFAARNNAGLPVSLSARGIEVRYEVHGYDRDKSKRLRGMMADMAAHAAPAVPRPPGQPQSLTPQQRQQLRAAIDGSAGLFSSFSMDETFRDFRVTLPQGAFSLGRLRIAIAGDGHSGHIAAHFDMDLDGIGASGVPPEVRPVLPRHIGFRAAVSGLPPANVRAFLRATLADQPNEALLRARAMALLAEPGVRAGVEAVSADLGPMQIRGFARVRPLPDGSATVMLHLTATGLDALLQSLQANPSTQRAIPVLLMAKGLARQEGDHLVWDIAFDHGATTVNGIALGAPGGGPSPPPPPLRR